MHSSSDFQWTFCCSVPLSRIPGCKQRNHNSVMHVADFYCILSIFLGVSHAQPCRFVSAGLWPAECSGVFIYNYIHFISRSRRKRASFPVFGSKARFIVFRSRRKSASLTVFGSKAPFIVSSATLIVFGSNAERALVSLFLVAKRALLFLGTQKERWSHCFW